MAPPRQRPADDSRSEASSGTREQKAPGPKSRKPGPGTSSATVASSVNPKDMKVAAAVSTVATLPETDQDAPSQTEELPGVSHTFLCLCYGEIVICTAFPF